MKIVSVYLGAIVYSAVRYVVFAPKNLEQLPVFVTNKGVSMAAALCFALAFWQQWRARSSNAVACPETASWFRAGLFGALAHVPMSLAILRPSYFSEFFAGDRLSFNGEAVVLFGGLTVAGLYLLGRLQWTPRHRWWLSLVTMATLLAHALSMGIARGLNINRSHAYLPPMWLLSVIGIAMGMGFLLVSYPGFRSSLEPLAGSTARDKT